MGRSEEREEEHRERDGGKDKQRESERQAKREFAEEGTKTQAHTRPSPGHQWLTFAHLVVGVYGVLFMETPESGSVFDGVCFSPPGSLLPLLYYPYFFEEKQPADSMDNVDPCLVQQPRFRRLRQHTHKAGGISRNLSKKSKEVFKSDTTTMMTKMLA